MTEKELFIENFKAKAKKFAVDVINFCNTLKLSKASAVITYQLIRSATSTGANYRAACRARSKSEFYHKICIVTEEADESLYWLELIDDSKLSKDDKELSRLKKTANEIIKIIAKTKGTINKNQSKYKQS